MLNPNASKYELVNLINNKLHTAYGEEKMYIYKLFDKLFISKGYWIELFTYEDYFDYEVDYKQFAISFGCIQSKRYKKFRKKIRCTNNITVFNFLLYEVDELLLEQIVYELNT